MLANRFRELVSDAPVQENNEPAAETKHEDMRVSAMPAEMLPPGLLM